MRTKYVLVIPLRRSHKVPRKGSISLARAGTSARQDALSAGRRLAETRAGGACRGAAALMARALRRALFCILGGFRDTETGLRTFLDFRIFGADLISFDSQCTLVGFAPEGRRHR